MTVTLPKPRLKPPLPGSLLSLLQHPLGLYLGLLILCYDLCLSVSVTGLENRSILGAGQACRAWGSTENQGLLHNP